jgi:Helitron helicase-like domain at N-terminus
MGFSQVEDAPLAVHVQGFADRNVEIAAIISADDSRINCRRDGIVFFRSAADARECGVTADDSGRYFVHNQSSQYESLQYPLFYPTGCGGWYCLPPPEPGNRGAPGELIPFPAPAAAGAQGANVEEERHGKHSEDVHRGDSSPAGRGAQQNDDESGEEGDGDGVYMNLPTDLNAGGDGDGVDVTDPRGDGGSDHDGKRSDGSEGEAPEPEPQPEPEAAPCPKKRKKSSYLRPLSTAGNLFTLHMFVKCLIMQCVVLSAIPRLGQEYMLDNFSRWEEITLHAMQNQTAVRFATTRQAAMAAERTGMPVGAPLPVIMPSSVPGSRKYQQTLIENGMAVITKYGKPTYWITVTCNPMWPEFADMTVKEMQYWDASPEKRTQLLENGDVSRDRVDLQVGLSHVSRLCGLSQGVCSCLLQVRIFHGYLQRILSDFRDGTIFGQPAEYLMYVVEFQKRGLPHAHICLRVQGDQPRTAAEIDRHI